MAFPTGIVTRPISFGPAITLEDATPLGFSGTIKASRRLVWAATGTDLIPNGTPVSILAGSEFTFALPVTDQTGYQDGSGNAIVVGDGENTHSYILTGNFVLGGRVVTNLNVGPFVLPAGDGSTVDLDTLLPVDAEGVTVSIPDQWTAAIAAAQASVTAAQAAATAAQNAAEAAQNAAEAAATASDASVEALVADPSSQTSAALSAIFAPKAAIDYVPVEQFIQPGESLVSDGSGPGDNTAIIQRGVTACNALYLADGRPRRLKFKDGTYVVACPNVSPEGNTYGVQWLSGVGIGTSSRRGVIFQVQGGTKGGSPFYAAKSMGGIQDVFWEPCVVDGSLVTAGYNAQHKGIYIQDLNNFEFRDIKIVGTLATGFGCDFLRNGRVTGEAIGCGRGIVSGALDPVASPGGAGFGIGTGMYDVENCDFDVYTEGNGKAGLFFETQNTGTSVGTPYHNSRGYTARVKSVRDQVALFDAGCDSLVATVDARGSKDADVRLSSTSIAKYAGVNGNLTVHSARSAALIRTPAGSLKGPYWVNGVLLTSRSPEYTGKAATVADTLTSSVTAGTNIAGRTTDQGLVWAQSGSSGATGTIVAVPGGLKLPKASGTTARTVALVDFGAPVLRCAVNVHTIGPSVYLVLRAADANNFIALGQSTSTSSVVIMQYNNGTGSVIATSATAAWGSYTGDVQLEVTDDGNTITGYIGGVQAVSWSGTTFATNTKAGVGFREDDYSPSGGASKTTYTNFFATTAAS